MARPRKTAPAASEPPAFDAHALIARVRAQDPEAISEAYRRVFGHDLGRLVLADLAVMGGVGMKYAGPPDLWSLGHHIGGHDLALDIIERAGFDQASAVAMVMTGELEGRDDELSATAHVEHDPVLPE